LPQDVFEALAAQEQFILTVTEKGFGKRTSAYDYRTTSRGGKGIVNVDVSKRHDKVVATFPVEPSDQIMLVTDSGQVIRFAVDEVRIASRRTQGVILFDVGDAGKVVSVARLRDVGEEDENGADNGNSENGEGETA
jgi:DNA gyrase subunit A